MSYASLYWRKFMRAEKFSPQQMMDTKWVKELAYPEGGGAYNRYALAYIWRKILVEAFEEYIHGLNIQHGSVELEWFVNDLYRELFIKSPSVRQEQKILQDATWQGYESDQELEDLEMLFYDLYSGDIPSLQWRIEDFYGIGLDLFFERTPLCYILQESQDSMFKFRNYRQRKSPELGNIYDLGSGPPWNGRVSFDVGPQELWFAYQAKEQLMYGEGSPEAIFQYLVDLGQRTDFSYYENSNRSREKIAVMTPSARNFDALMNFADNIFMGQVFYEDRWEDYHRPVQPLVFCEPHGPMDEGSKEKHIARYNAARKATEDYLQQRRDFFDGAA